MEREKRIIEEVEKTLRALDELPKLRANPFLYTRLKSVLANAATPDEQPAARQVRVKAAALALLVVINVLSAIHFLGRGPEGSSRSALISSLERDYSSPHNDLMGGN